MSVHVRILNRFRQLNERRIAAQRKPLAQAGALVMTIARRKIRTSDKESSPGTPPHTKTRRLKKAILFAAESERVVIGPSVELFGTAGRAHEHGGEFRDEVYPERPFMGPSLKDAAPRVSAFWSNSLT